MPVTNTAPTAVKAVADRTVRKGILSEFNVLFSDVFRDVFRDAEQDALTLDITQANGSPLPSWLGARFDAATGEIVFSAAPPAGSGDTDIVVKLIARETTNPANEVATVFTVRSRTNTAPRLISNEVAQLNAKTGREWAAELPAWMYFIDEDVGDVLTLSLDNAAALPAWLQVDLSNPFVLRLSGTPLTSESITLQVRATDQNGASVVKTIQLRTAANAGPNLISPPSLGEASVGRYYSWTQSISQLFVDPNGDHLQVKATGLPSWLNFTYIDQANPVLRLDGNVPATVADGTTYAVTLTATDPDGQTTSVTLQLVARTNRPPVVITPDGYQLPSIRRKDPLDVTLAVSRLFVDLEGDALTAEALNLPSWIRATVDNVAGTVRLVGLPILPEHTGLVSFQIRARDTAGLASTATVLINVGADNFPIRTAGVALNDMTLSIGRSFSVTLPENLYTEIDGDGVWLSPAVVEQHIEYGGDTGAPNTTVVEDAAWPSWMVFDQATRTLSGQVPPGTAPGSFVIRVRGVDGRGNTSGGGNTLGAAGISSDSDITVNVVPFVNTLPVYTDGSMPRRSLNDGTPVNFTLPAGAFVDPDGDTLTYSAHVQLPDYYELVPDPKLPGEYLEEPVLRPGKLVELSTIGLAINATTGTITGTPTNLEYLNYRIQVYARDPAGGYGVGKFAVTVLNAGPRAPGATNQTAHAGVAWSHTVPKFEDANNETLTYTVSNMPAWMSFNPATRQLSGTASVVGTWAVTVTATDAAGASASTTVTVLTPNAGPVLTRPLPAHETWRNTAWAYQIPADAFVDPNGDALTWSVSGLPAGISFNAANRTLSGYSTTLGAYNVTVSVSDGRGGTSATSFVINVTNVQPVYNGGLPNRAAQQNEQVNWPMPAGTFVDYNGDALTYSIMVERPGYDEYYWDAYDAVWSLRWVPPTWLPNSTLSINPTTGTVTGTLPVFTKPVHPQTGQGGGYLPSFRIKIIASDGLATAEAIFSGSLNHAPVGALSNQYIKSGVATSFQVNAFTDPNGDALTYSASGLPAGMWFDAANRTVNGSAAAGTYTITIHANDGRGAVGSASFTLNVRANNAPTAPAVGNYSMQVGTGVGVILPAFTDPDADPLSYQLSALPPGLWWDPGSRTIGGTPTAAGNYGMQFVGVDGRGGVTSVYFTIYVAAAPIPNRAPYVAIQPPSPAAHFYTTTQYMGQDSTFTLPPNTFIDPDNNPLTYTILAKPSFLSYGFSPTSGHIFTGRNNDTRAWANHTIIIRATDPSGLYVDVSFTVTSEYYRYNPGNPVDPFRVTNPALLVAEEPLAPVAMTMALAAPEVTAWAGPVQIAGGVAPSSMSPVSTANGNGSVPVETKDYWYTYDAENRILVNNGVLQNGQIVLATATEDSYSLAYDAAGNIVSRTTNRTANGLTTYWIDRTTYDLRGNRVFEYYTDTIENGYFKAGGGIQRRLIYDAANHLTASHSYFASGSYWIHTIGSGNQTEHLNTYYYGGWLSGAETYSYDGDGRITLQQSLRRSSDKASWLVGSEGNDAHQHTDVGVLDLQSGTDYAGGYDALGRLVSYRYVTPTYTHTYTTSYTGRESWLQQSVSGTSSHGNYRATNNTLSYDAFGRLMSQRETTPLQNGSIDDRMRYYANDVDGRVVNRREGTLNSNGVFTQTAVNGPGNFRLIHANGQQVAELREGYQDIVSGKPYTSTQLISVAGGGRREAVAQAGDTLRTIAQRVYGPDQMWYVLATANGFGDPDAEIGAGTRLTTPETSINRNDTGTFKQYDSTSRRRRSLGGGTTAVDSADAMTDFS